VFRDYLQKTVGGKFDRFVPRGGGKLAATTHKGSREPVRAQDVLVQIPAFDTQAAFIYRVGTVGQRGREAAVYNLVDNSAPCAAVGANRGNKPVIHSLIAVRGVLFFVWGVQWAHKLLCL
jgi:hypothetical protein